MPTAVRVLSAGAAQGLIESLGERLREEIDVVLQVAYGPVGLTREAVCSGTPCDVVILSAPVAAALTESGHLSGETAVALGKVHTAICTREATTAPKISTPADLAEGLLTADEICLPDPERATAGIHLTQVLHQLAIYERVRDRLAVHPNGAAIAHAVASSTAPLVLGCAQMTEIIATAGANLVGPLPGPLDLATTYTASVSARAEQPDLARSLIAVLTGAGTATARRDAGFLPA